MESEAKETVIIVHGTWASPDAGKDRWYHPGGHVPTEGFISKLDAALQKRESSARCWAHCRESGGEVFHWSGENSWVARTRAADALGNYVAKLQKDGWRCHIVAHSHGGNVVIEAIPRIMAASDSVLPGRLVTLGTPFIDTVTPALKRDAERESTLLSLSGVVFIYALIATLLYLWREPGARLAVLIVSSGLFLILFFGALILRWSRLRLRQASLSMHLVTNWKSLARELTFCIVAGTLLAFGLRPPYEAIHTAIALSLFVLLFFGKQKWARYEQTELSTPSKPFEAHPQLLAMGSRMDEAWQVLHHLRDTKNPLAVKTNFFRYLHSAFRSDIQHRVAMDRIYYGSAREIGFKAALGAGLTWLYIAFTGYQLFDQFPRPKNWDALSAAFSFASNTVSFSLLLILLFGNRFFAALIFPLRWCSRVFGSLLGIAVAIGTYAVRHASWSVFLKIVMGLDGYQLDVPIVEQCPSRIREDRAQYEDMPASAEQLALKNRSGWVERHLEDVSQTFSKLVITASDISLLLSKIEADQTLVHAAYYTDDQCIARIADWLAVRDKSNDLT